MWWRSKYTKSLAGADLSSAFLFVCSIFREVHNIWFIRISPSAWREREFWHLCAILGYFAHVVYVWFFVHFCFAYIFPLHKKNMKQGLVVFLLLKYLRGSFQMFSLKTTKNLCLVCLLYITFLLFILVVLTNKHHHDMQSLCSIVFSLEEFQVTVSKLLRLTILIRIVFE